MVTENIIIFFLGLITRLILGFTTYTKSLGIELSNTKAGNSFQNAIIPPLFPMIAILVYGISFCAIAYCFLQTSFVSGLINLIIYLSSLIITGAIFFMPNKLSPLARLFHDIVFNSMLARYNDCKKKNDKTKAEEIKILLNKFEEAYKKN